MCKSVSFVTVSDDRRAGKGCMDRVGQNHTFIGIYGVYTVFLAEKSPEGVI